MSLITAGLVFRPVGHFGIWRVPAEPGGLSFFFGGFSLRITHEDCGSTNPPCGCLRRAQEGGFLVTTQTRTAKSHIYTHVFASCSLSSVS